MKSDRSVSPAPASRALPRDLRIEQLPYAHPVVQALVGEVRRESVVR